MIALVLGGAHTVWDDVLEVETAINAKWPGLVVATNDAGASWPRALDAWATLHPEKMPGWRRKRASNGFEEAAMHVAHRADAGIDRVVRQDGPMIGGSSGLFATYVAFDVLGASGVVLCGVPMDGGRNGFTGSPWTQHGRYRRGWERSVNALRGRVFSMSGWTRELLGYPRAGFLAASAVGSGDEVPTIPTDEGEES